MPPRASRRRRRAAGAPRNVPPAPRLVERRSHGLGQAPGVLPPHPEVASPARLSALHYDADGAEAHDALTPEAARALTDRPGVTWISLDGATDTRTVAALGEAFGLHPLLIEDLATLTQRPKLEVSGDHLVVIARMVQATDLPPEVAYCDGDPETLGHRIEQVGLVLGPGYVLSVQESEGDAFETVRERIRTGGGRVRKAGADYLLYSLLDVIVDHVFVTLERVGDAAVALEDLAIETPDQEVQAAISSLRREVVTLRRTLWPLREVLVSLQREDLDVIEAATRPYLRDVYDHLVQAVDIVEALREVLAALSDLYLSALGMRQNEVMKVLTVVGTVFLPLTFLTGLYGMNFDVMPELHAQNGYFVLLGVMALLSAGILLYFRRKGWL